MPASTRRSGLRTRSTSRSGGENRHRHESLRRLREGSVVLGELRAGFLGGSRAPENEANLARFLNSPRVEVLLADEETTHHYARLFHQLRRQGTPIPTNDIWIAALVTQHQLYLFARDDHFDHLPQIPRL
jgi:tRNA(fMet)-specific endonuclease VapC